MTTPKESYYVQVHTFENKDSRGCICTIKSAQVKDYLIKKHGGEFWEDRSGLNFFEGPFATEEDAKVFMTDLVI